METNQKPQETGIELFSESVCDESMFTKNQNPPADRDASSMGIRGLTSYLEREPDLWTTVYLKNTKVVIDGNGLFYWLYISSELDCRRGGQYNAFHDRVRSFFERLDSNGVQAFVVLDGASDPSDRKLATSIKRAKESINSAYNLASNSLDAKHNVRPKLLRRAFIQALDDLEVKFSVCD